MLPTIIVFRRPSKEAAPRYAIVDVIQPVLGVSFVERPVLMLDPPFPLSICDRVLTSEAEVYGHAQVHQGAARVDGFWQPRAGWMDHAAAFLGQWSPVVLASADVEDVIVEYMESIEFEGRGLEEPPWCIASEEDLLVFQNHMIQLIEDTCGPPLPWPG